MEAKHGSHQTLLHKANSQTLPASKLNSSLYSNLHSILRSPPSSDLPHNLLCVSLCVKSLTDRYALAIPINACCFILSASSLLFSSKPELKIHTNFQNIIILFSPGLFLLQLLSIFMALTSTVASSSTKLSPPKRLGELLEEQQEPFVLEIYLLERGCRRKGLDFKGGNIGCFSTDQDNNIETTKFSKKSSSFNGLNPSRKSSAQLSSITKSLYNKLISVNKVRKSKNGSKVKKSRKRDKETVDSGRCSSASCSTLSNITWSASDTDGDSMPSPVKNAIELAADRVTAQWRLVDENKQCSPVSVLDEIDLLQAIPVYNVRQDQGPPAESRITYQKKVSDDSLLSASLWELLLQSRKEKPKKTGSKSLPQFINSKKALQQTRQLLFDCVREVVEENNNGKQKRIKKDKGLMGPEEIGKIICSNLKAWGKLSADETNIKTLLRTDLLGSAGGWGGFEACKPDIVVEIGNCIVEEITDDIVRDMINLN